MPLSLRSVLDFKHQSAGLHAQALDSPQNRRSIAFADRLADLEVRINGKGVVNDSVKRPFILYRILLGLLPF